MDDVLLENVTVDYTCLQGWTGLYGGVGNIADDPQFVDPDGGDYHIQSGSPAVDAADNTAVPEGAVTDLDGNPRFVDHECVADTGNPDGVNPIVDMGVYEYQPDGEKCCVGDLDDDSIVGTTDLLLLLGAWGAVGHPADFVDPVGVGPEDLIVLLGNWGPCPK